MNKIMTIGAIIALLAAGGCSGGANDDGRRSFPEETSPDRAGSYEAAETSPPPVTAERGAAKQGLRVSPPAPGPAQRTPAREDAAPGDAAKASPPGGSAQQAAPAPSAPAPAAKPEPPPSASAGKQAAPSAQRKAEPPRTAERAKRPSAAAKQAAPTTRPASRSLSLSELARMYPDTFKRYGPAHKREIALTFDDAPDAKYTPQVLDVLKAHKVKATFFLVGHRANLHPDLVRRMVREGHAIGNHSYNHPNFAKLSLESFTQQIEQTQNILKPLIGYNPRLIRPPYGEIKQEQLEWAAARHMMIVNWNVDSLDWKQLDADHVSANILTHVGPGAIVLQHSGGGVGQDLSGTVKALPGIIQKLRTYGFSLVTVPELLDIPKEN
ncbi:polysaccharide deacetylase family protein [Paenibacillus sp. MBLB4367]|uniref:polysaccharide deacetylase family protein n=1 Tax=Paenibacillus sp. MBLB4367 TaxID=3384767 RepID=UPI003908257A